jgi:hypothetical protein
MQLDIFENSEGFKPRKYGRITFGKLSLHEKINLKAYYHYMPWNLPYHEGFLSHYSYYETSYEFYVKNGLTEKLDDHFYVMQKYHYKDLVYYHIAEKKKKDENKRRNTTRLLQ